jgi:hypothetical protein
MSIKKKQVTGDGRKFLPGFEQTESREASRFLLLGLGLWTAEERGTAAQRHRHKLRFSYFSPKRKAHFLSFESDKVSFSTKISSDISAFQISSVWREYCSAGWIILIE